MRNVSSNFVHLRDFAFMVSIVRMNYIVQMEV